MRRAERGKRSIDRCPHTRPRRRSALPNVAWQGTAPLNSIFRAADKVVRPTSTVFYGWWIVLSAAGIQFLGGLLFMQSYGAYVVQLERELGWSQAVLAGAFSLTRIESGFLGPLQGYLCDRYGPRVVLVTGTVVFASGFFAFSQVNTVLHFYAAIVLIALGSSLGGYASLTVAIVNWFERHRSKAVAVSQMGYAFGGLSVPLIVICLGYFGWRTTAILSGCLVLLIGVPLACVIRDRPAKYGLERDGVVYSAGDRPRGGPVELDMTARQAMRTSAFWLISLGHAIALLSVSTVAVHVIPHLVSGVGFSPLAAGFAISLMTAFQIVGQLIGGALGDRFEKRTICAVCLIAHALGMLCVASATSTPYVVAFAVLHGCAWGVRGTLMPAIRADYFGAGSFGLITGISGLVVMLGMSAGPLLSGVLADLTGDYRAGFLLISGSALVGSLLFALARRPERPLLSRQEFGG